MAELQAKWGHLSSAERSALTQAKLEANAYRRLQDIQSKTPGAHFLERHGAQLDLQSQYDRAALGINPTTGAQQFTPPSATRFLSHRDQLNAIQRSEQIFANTGDISLAEAPMKFDYIIGSGYQRVTLDYGVSYSAQVYLNAFGKVKTAFPIWGQ